MQQTVKWGVKWGWWGRG